FFFQAEDGIRDFHVTGVQTCALPIYQSVYEGEEVELDGSQSYSTYGDHTFSWTAPEGIELSSDFDSRPTFTAPQVDADSMLVFKIGRASCRERVEITGV